MKDYMLIIKIPFTGLDDLDARNKAKAKIKDLPLDDAELKVQEVFKDQPPRKVPL